MRIKTALNHKERARRSVMDMVHPYHSHAQILEQYKKILSSIDHCPSWVKREIAECLRTKIELMYRYELEWCVLEWEGTRYTSWDSLPESGKEYIRTHPSTDPYLLANQYHYWKSSGVKFS